MDIEMLALKKLQKLQGVHGLNEIDLAKRFGIPKEQLLKIDSGTIKMPEWLPHAIGKLEAGLLENGRKRKVPTSRFRFIDLFAGIGGIRIAFEKAKGDCVFTSEWDKYPAKVYEDNFGDKPFGDITKIKVEDIPSHDILTAGFPCQPFSIAGVSKKNSLGVEHGFECKTQGTLFFDVARILKHHRPKMFFLENVKNLKSHDKGNTFKIIMETLREGLGYTVSAQVIDGGLLVPQHRERIYIVGTLDHGNPFEFPKIRKKDTTLKDILEKRVDHKYTLRDGLWNALQRHAEKHRAKGNGFGYGINKRTGKARTLSARYYKDGAEILIEQRGKNPRRLTPRECARLMGFSDRFKITVSDTRAYRCFGNSIVVPIVEKIAKKMAKSNILENTKKREVMTCSTKT